MNTKRWGNQERYRPVDSDMKHAVQELRMKQAMDLLQTALTMHATAVPSQASPCIADLRCYREHCDVLAADMRHAQQALSRRDIGWTPARSDLAGHERNSSHVLRSTASTHARGTSPGTSSQH